MHNNPTCVHSRSGSSICIFFVEVIQLRLDIHFLTIFWTPLSSSVNDSGACLSFKIVSSFFSFRGINHFVVAG